jgi:hypothetical protein
MTLTQTLAWRRSSVVSTPVIVATDDGADLLPEKLVDAFGSLAHVDELLCRTQGRSGEGASEHHSERTSGCVSERAEDETHAGAFMRVASVG